MEAFGNHIKQDSSRTQLKYGLGLTVMDRLNGKMWIPNEQRKVAGPQLIDITLTFIGAYPRPRWESSPGQG